MKTSPYRAFSHDVTSAIWLYQNNKAAAMLVFQTNPFGVEPFSYVKTFFCSNKFAQPLTAWVKTLYRSDIHCKPDQKNVYRSVTIDTLYPAYKAYLVSSHLSCSSCRACYEVDWGRTTKITSHCWEHEWNFKSQASSYTVKVLGVICVDDAKLWIRSIFFYNRIEILERLVLANFSEKARPLKRETNNGTIVYIL